MNMDTNHNARHRSFNGCWTCRLRRKRCDERHPICGTCTTLLITCYYDQEKPDWMDGGEKQRVMAEQVKSEIKEKAKMYGRRGDRELASFAISTPSESRTPIPDQSYPRCNRTAVVESSVEGHGPSQGHDGTLIAACGNSALSPSETVLISFYLDHVVPFLFPFYKPSPFEGGYSWILEFLLNSPIKRNATLSQAKYFFSLGNDEIPPQLSTEDDFPMLRQALDIIVGEGVENHLHGCVRILTGIMQIMHFEISKGGFENWSAHLNAALALFEQMLATARSEYCSGFNTVIDRLGTGLLIAGIQVQRAEHAALRFSTATLLFADIIASTAEQKEPSLYKLHDSLLGGGTPPIHLEETMGVQNWVLLGIGEVASIDAWKHHCKASGNLDMMELVHRATCIKERLSYELKNMATTTATASSRSTSGLFEEHNQADITTFVTRLWGHAALLYLNVVVNGWQPATLEVRCHVQKVIELLSHQLSPPSMLRTLAWPFCVAGCLAEPSQEVLFCALVEKLPAPSVFGTIHKAHDIMANVWRNRDSINSMDWNLASSFKTCDRAVVLI